MAELRIYRRADYFGFFRRMLIEVDGKVSARLRPDQEQTVTVTAGRHVLQARMDWTTSKPIELDVGDDDNAEFETALPMRALLDMIIRPGSAVVLRRVRR